VYSTTFPENQSDHFTSSGNQQPKPFVWTADPDKIIAAANRGHIVLDSIH
jgi:hypothetical protein